MNEKPIVFSVYFPGEGPNSTFYARMARVLEYTAGRHCSTWNTEIREIKGPGSEYPSAASHSHASNTHKLNAWNRRIQAAEDGDRILLMDGDMMILRPLDPVWDLAFDLAYTTKKSKLPFNGGVLFLRVSDRTKKFMQAYWDKNVEFLGNSKLHYPFRSKFGGMNQAAFGALLPEIETTFGLKLIELPCLEWNCEQSAWRKFDPAVTRIVHVKSGLRKAIFGRGPADAETIPLMEIWKGLEREAHAATKESKAS